MKDYTLSKEEIAELGKLHRSLRDKRQAGHVKAVSEQHTRMQEKRKVIFINRALVSGWLLWFPDRRALPASDCTA
jgi:hypothetical protein